MEISVGPASETARGSWNNVDHTLPAGRYYPVNSEQLLVVGVLLFLKLSISTENL